MDSFYNLGLVQALSEPRFLHLCNTEMGWGVSPNTTLLPLKTPLIILRARRYRTTWLEQNAPHCITTAVINCFQKTDSLSIKAARPPQPRAQSGQPVGPRGPRGSEPAVSVGRGWPLRPCIALLPRFRYRVKAGRAHLLCDSERKARFPVGSCGDGGWDSLLRRDRRTC